MAANKPFGDEVNSLGMALSMFAITKSDSVDFATAARQIYVGTGGDVALVDSRGNVVVHKNVGSGSYLGPFTVVRVNSTSTTAADMVGYV